MRDAIERDVTADCTPLGGESDPSRVGALGAVAAVMRSAASLLADLFDRIVHGIRCLAPLALGVGCQGSTEIPDVAPAVIEPVPASTVPRAEDIGPRPLGQFTITFYYVIGEDEVGPARVANENRNSGEAETELAAVTPDLVTLYGGTRCEPIAEVSREFASQ